MSQTTTSDSDSENRDSVAPIEKSSLGSVRKRPRQSEDFFDALLWQICYDYFTPPVIQCESGHSFWKKCVDKLLPHQRKWPVCRKGITEIRNYTVEQQLEKLETECTYAHKGCKCRVSLGGRELHESECEFAPRISWYFAHSCEGHVCFWKGPLEELARHLQDTHDVIQIDRDKQVKFLWTPPIETSSRVRYRILNMALQSAYPTPFILEHCYNATTRNVVFLVRSLNQDFKYKYCISLMNRFDSSNYLSFDGETVSFEDYGDILQDVDDHKKCFSIPYTVLKDYVFYNEEDDDKYFSLIVEFKL